MCPGRQHASGGLRWDGQNHLGVSRVTCSVDDQVGDAAYGAGASFSGVLERSTDPQQMTFLHNIFCTTPKAENGQPTVKCRDYLIFQAPKCTKSTFPVASPRTHWALILTTLTHTLS